LRALDENSRSIENGGIVKYITPERSGQLKHIGSIEQNIENPQFLREKRRRNQLENFKEQTVAQYRKLKEWVGEEFEEYFSGGQNGSPPTPMRDHLNRINDLLSEVELVERNPTFFFRRKGTADEILPHLLSSGESELISLVIEGLVFDYELKEQKNNLFLLDAPDVHLHPDLQTKLMQFFRDKVESNSDFKVIIATHSTAIVGALENYSGVNVAFIKSGETIIKFRSVTEIYKKILPIFGAHALSNVFNERPIFLVEGEDDERIWQKAVRTSLGTIKVYPCVAGSKQDLRPYEIEVKNILNAVYENGHAYSIRDGDGVMEDISDDEPITRFRLKCYSAENLLLKLLKVDLCS